MTRGSRVDPIFENSSEDTLPDFLWQSLVEHGGIHHIYLQLDLVLAMLEI